MRETLCQSGVAWMLHCLIGLATACRSNKQSYSALLEPQPQIKLVAKTPVEPKYPLLHKTQRACLSTAKFVGGGIFWLTFESFKSSLKDDDDDRKQRPPNDYLAHPQAHQANW
ncbi:MAG: hypothetical protein AAFU85_33710 [Planctomycetota bacterium]